MQTPSPESPEPKSYNNLEELKKAYGNENVILINSVEEYKSMVMADSESAKKEGKNVFYRGQREAAWICRSTLLRRYIDSALHTSMQFRYFSFINRYLWGYLRCSRSIEKTVELYKTVLPFLREYDMPDHMKKMLAYKPEEDDNAQWRENLAQHFGLPTSLIDFSRNPDKALYFATNKLEQGNGVRNHISQYCAIIRIIATNEQIPNWEECRLRDVTRFAEDVKSNGTNEERKILRGNIPSWNENDDTSILDEIPLITYIDQSEGRWVFNDRMKAQEGILLCLGRYQSFSLEEAIENQKKDTVDTIDNVTCFLINKSLCEELKQRLKEQGITKKSLQLDH